MKLKKIDKNFIFSLISVILSRIFFYIEYIIMYHRYDGFYEAFNRWDVGWYISLAKSGYQLPQNVAAGEAANWAFFPLYPYLIGYLAKLLNLSEIVIAFWIGNFLLVMICYWGSKYICDSWGFVEDSKINKIFSIMMCFGCYSFYCSSFYTEAPYLILIIAVLIFLEKEQYLAAGICSAFLSATRNIGVFIAFVFLASWLQKYEKYKNISLGQYFKNTISNIGNVIGALLIPLGLILHMIELYNVTGDALAFVHIQSAAAWGRVNIGIFKVIENIIIKHGGGLYYLVWFVFSIVILLWLMIKKHRYHEVVLGAYTIFIPMQSSADSIPRYIFGCFVFYEALTILIAEKYSIYRRILLGVFCVWEFVLLALWFKGWPVVA